MNQMDVLQGFGQGARGIQDKMYGAQFDAATGLAAEPGNRMKAYQGMLGMLPNTYAGTTFGTGTSDNNAFNIMSLLGLLGGSS